MDNSISNQVDEKGSTDEDKKEPELKVDDQLPTPPRSVSAPAKDSDAEAADSQRSVSPQSNHRRGGRKAKQSDELEIPQEQPPSQNEQSDSSRRRHQRGGRKTRTKSQRLRSAAEIQLLGGQPPEQDEESDSSLDDSEEEEASSSDYDYDAEELHKAKSRNPTVPTSSKKQSPLRMPKVRTDVKAFNIRRADPNGKAPLSVTIERPGSESKPKKDKKKKKKRRESNDEESEKEEKKEGRKPVSIRLDLNLELDIVFTAKIKGDITITFLE